MGSISTVGACTNFDLSNTFLGKFPPSSQGPYLLLPVVYYYEHQEGKACPRMDRHEKPCMLYNQLSTYVEKRKFYKVQTQVTSFLWRGHGIIHPFTLRVINERCPQDLKQLLLLNIIVLLAL